MTMQAQRFGVEIEFTGITRKTAAAVVAEHFGTTATYSGNGYDTRKVSDQQGRTWKVMSDSSITAQRREDGRRVSADGAYKCELVTPILSYGDIETLQEIVRKLREAGAIANASCGIHIHVDAAPHTAKTLRNLMNLVASKEDMLYRALGVNSGRYSYCKKADKDVLGKVNAAKPSEMRRLEEIWYSTATTITTTAATAGSTSTRPSRRARSSSGSSTPPPTLATSTLARSRLTSSSASRSRIRRSPRAEHPTARPKPTTRSTHSAAGSCASA